VPSSAQALIRLHEGERLEPYKDSLGYWTIGVGHLIDARKGGSLLGVPAIPLTSEQSATLLKTDVEAHRADLLRALPWVAMLSDVRQAVLLDMAFNLGVGGLLGFKNTLSMVRAGDYVGAAKGMLQSKWASQVGPRAIRLSRMMETNTWPSLS
jgi:lysozyme